MGWFDKGFDVLKSNITIDVQLEHLRERASKIETRMDSLESGLNDVLQRLVRLETQRDADKAEMRAEVAQFKADVERAAQRLLPPSS